MTNTIFINKNVILIFVYSTFSVMLELKELFESSTVLLGSNKQTLQTILGKIINFGNYKGTNILQQTILGKIINFGNYKGTNI